MQVRFTSRIYKGRDIAGILVEKGGGGSGLYSFKLTLLKKMGTQ